MKKRSLVIYTTGFILILSLLLLFKAGLAITGSTVFNLQKSTSPIIGLMIIATAVILVIIIYLISTKTSKYDEKIEIVER